MSNYTFDEIMEYSTCVNIINAGGLDESVYSYYVHRLAEIMHTEEDLIKLAKQCGLQDESFLVGIYRKVNSEFYFPKEDD